MKSILFIILAAVGMTSCQEPVKVRIPDVGKTYIYLDGNFVADLDDTIHVEYNEYTNSWKHDPSGQSDRYAIVEAVLE